MAASSSHLDLVVHLLNRPSSQPEPQDDHDLICQGQALTCAAIQSTGWRSVKPIAKYHKHRKSYLCLLYLQRQRTHLCSQTCSKTATSSQPLPLSTNLARSKRRTKYGLGTMIPRHHPSLSPWMIWNHSKAQTSLVSSLNRPYPPYFTHRLALCIPSDVRLPCVRRQGQRLSASSSRRDLCIL